MKSSFKGYWGGVKSTFMFLFGLGCLGFAFRTWYAIGHPEMWKSILMNSQEDVGGSWIAIVVAVLVGISFCSPLLLDLFNKNELRDYDLEARLN